MEHKGFNDNNLICTSYLALFLECDKDGSGEISFDEFLDLLRGPMSKRRREVLTEVFRGIDR